MNKPTLSTVIEYESMKNITKQFSRLKDFCYLDNTGAALYPESLIKKMGDDLINNIYMNPHSDIHALECIEGVREMILQHFYTNPSEYSVIFTSGATQALKLVIESFQFGCESNENIKRGAFVHLRDNHTSVLGLRELAKINNVDISFISHEDFLKTLSYDVDINNSYEENNPHKTGNALLAYPAQNNFNGFKYPINCMNHIKKGRLNKYVHKTDDVNSYNWYILLDTASFVSTNSLDLSVVKADFVCLSFYKIFGYPTGLGALLVRNDCISLLSEKKYYGGGTVDTLLNTETFFARKKHVSERFEDGTISFLSIMALRHCFEIFNNLIPKTVNNNVMDTVSYHTYYLAKDLYIRLKQLKYQNGRMAIIFYMDSDFTDVKKQGGIVTFNIVREDGSFVGYNEFENESVSHKICIRSGCFCNSGSCQRHFKLSNKKIKDRYEAGHKCGGETDLLDGEPTGAIRVSFGYYNTYIDVDKLINMISRSYLKTYTMMPNEDPVCMNRVKLQLFQQINYEDDFVKEYNSNKMKIMPNLTLKEIIIYPIELCGPYRIKSSWKINNKELEYNKKWKIISRYGAILTQNQIWLMSKIYPEIDLNYNNMILHMEGMNSISVCLEADLLYHSNIDYDCGDKVANWISEAVNCPNLRLVEILTDKKVTKRNKVTEDIHLLDKQNSVILVNIPTINQSADQRFESIKPVNEGTLANSIRGNLVVDMPQESFTGDWDRVIIGDHEFKVVGHYSQNLKVYTDHKNDISLKPMAQFSKETVVAMYLNYVRTSNKSTKTIKVTSKITPIKTDARKKNMKEKADSNLDSNLDKDSKINFTSKLKYLLRKRQKYKIKV